MSTAPVHDEEETKTLTKQVDLNQVKNKNNEKMKQVPTPENDPIICRAIPLGSTYSIKCYHLTEKGEEIPIPKNRIRYLKIYMSEHQQNLKPAME